jgi:deoxyadenosine/deoxycytidine kinase
MKIIGLTGPKGSGKDTVADILVSHYRSQWKTVHRLAFADPIKKVIQHIFALDPTSLQQYDDFKRTTLHFTIPNTSTRNMKMLDVSARHVVREIGMMMREYDDKQFNNYIEEHFKKAYFTSNNVFVVTDLRFDNEYTMLRQWGAKIVKVDRPGYAYDGHITERGFDDQLVDYTIRNSGSLTDLTTATRDLISAIDKESK